MKKIQQKKIRAIRAEHYKEKVVWLLTRPLVPLAVLLIFIERKINERKKKTKIIPLNSKKAHQYITKMIVDVLIIDDFCIFSYGLRHSQCHYSVDSHRAIKNKWIAKWWYRVNRTDLIDYIENKYNHPELTKYQYLPFRNILEKYTTLHEKAFDEICFDSPEYEPMKKAKADWEEQTKIFEAFAPCWYPSIYEPSEKCIIFRQTSDC